MTSYSWILDKEGLQDANECVVNVAVLGSLGYLSYLHWDEPVWDRRYIASVTAGLLALFAGQGCVDICISMLRRTGPNTFSCMHSLVAESYREREYPKRR